MVMTYILPGTSTTMIYPSPLPINQCWNTLGNRWRHWHFSTLNGGEGVRVFRYLHASVQRHISLIVGLPTVQGCRPLRFPPFFLAFDYLRIMFAVGCLWNKYNISWADYIKLNTLSSRQAVNIDFRHFHRSQSDTFHNCLFVAFPSYGPPYHDYLIMSPVTSSLVCFLFRHV